MSELSPTAVGFISRFQTLNMHGVDDVSKCIGQRDCRVLNLNSRYNPLKNAR